jgi:hypothetical protein
MRKMVMAVTLLAALVATSGRADAATLQVLLHVEGDKEIDIPIDQPPLEFQGLIASWGNVTFGNGNVLVGHYVFDREDKRHQGTLAPTQYPNPFVKIMIRTVGIPSQLLVLEGSVPGPGEGSGTFGGVTVATGPLAFLRGADFTTEVTSEGVLVTFTF